MSTHNICFCEEKSALSRAMKDSDQPTSPQSNNIVSLHCLPVEVLDYWLSTEHPVIRLHR